MYFEEQIKFCSLCCGLLVKQYPQAKTGEEYFCLKCNKVTASNNESAKA